MTRAGYEIILVGRKKKNSLPLTSQPFKQTRLFCFFEKGKAFYLEYNLRLLFFLLFRKMRGICAIDLDTILPVYCVSRIKKIPRIYDAHELFCEMKEIVSRPQIYTIWKAIERKTVPHFEFGYTVNEAIAREFRNMYGSEYEVIRSIARYNPVIQHAHKEKFILYQGAVNEGRSFETLIPAMQFVNGKLVICGDGNFLTQARYLVERCQLEDKVIFKGMIQPEELKQITAQAYIGITLFEKDAKSNYYSLANRFFDYIQSGVPQLCVDYPVYKEINNLHAVAVLINDLDSRNIANCLNDLLNDEDEWLRLHNNCIEASKELNWENEEIKLVSFYKKIFG